MRLGTFGSNGSYTMPVISQDVGDKDKLRSHSYHAKLPWVVKRL